MSSISSNLYEGNKPSHFDFRNAELSWRKIWLNEVSLNELICFFIRSFSRKIREVIREEKIEKAKGWEEVNAELFIAE